MESLGSKVVLEIIQVDCFKIYIQEIEPFLLTNSYKSKSCSYYNSDGEQTLPLRFSLSCPSLCASPACPALLQKWKSTDITHRLSSQSASAWVSRFTRHASPMRPAPACFQRICIEQRLAPIRLFGVRVDGPREAVGLTSQRRL